MRICAVVVVVLIFTAVAVAAQNERPFEWRDGEARRVPLKNWPVAFDAVISRLHPEVHGVPTTASHFVAVVPCRVLDTRNSGSPLPANTTTSVDVPGSGCGIPAGAAAYSMNFTAMNPADNGFLTAYPTGSVRPTTATLSYLLNGPAFDNAAIVPAGTGGAIDVYVAAQLHLILDINGYFVEGVVTSVATSDGLSGGGTGAVTVGITNGGIADAKLGAITTPGKVANSATTATSANTAGAIVARDAAGAFAAGALTLSGKVDQTSIGGLVATGAIGSGTIPAAGPGVRLMWYPRKGAFRAGYIEGSQWDDASIGNHSTATGYDTTARGLASTAMGRNTTASGETSTAMGISTIASGDYSTAAGLSAAASGFASTAIGERTTASGSASIATGRNTTASAPVSTAMGAYASTTDLAGVPRQGTFVWGDGSTVTLVRPTAPHQFVARASGGVTFYSNYLMSTGVTLAASGGSWASVSDRARKTDFDAVDGEAILHSLAGVPVESWRYRDDVSGRRYIGPVAQDFHAAFGLGNDKTIATLDVDGVTLAGVKALEKRTAALQAETAALKAENSSLREQLERLARSIERLETDRRQ